MKDVEIGDVVAGSKIYGYELGKAREDFAPRPDFGGPAYPLIQRARAVAEAEEWLRRIDERSDQKSQRRPRAFIGPIAAGEKVVASKQSAVYKLLKENFSDAIAVEMEGYGFFQAVQANHGMQALAVRGISDLIEGKAEADASGSQERAARHAAAFAFQVLARTKHPTSKTEEVSSNVSKGITDENVWSGLASLAEELYPEGPKDNQIWMRAGGSLASLRLAGSGRGRWFEALRKLKLGGGGSDITLELLLDTMLQDYPSNETLLEIKREVEDG